MVSGFDPCPFADFNIVDDIQVDDWDDFLEKWWSSDEARLVAEESDRIAGLLLAEYLS